jgi:hypothetical protein
MIFCPDKYKSEVKDWNKEFLSLEGELDNETAKITLAKFLRYNLDFTAEWVAGVQLAPYQLIALKAFFLRNYVMCVFGRGGAKSFLTALGAFLISIMEPGTNIIICGPVFRVVKNIFGYLEKIQQNPDAILLKQCLGKYNKGNDLYTWQIGDSTIRGIPNNGQKTRGMRANVLFVDEFFQMSEQIVKEVLTPFLVAPTNVKDRIRIRREEDQMIRKGKMTEADRVQFANSTRMICTSSASYSFEYLYRLYQDWTQKIYSEEEVAGATYFIQQVSWDAVPDYLMSKEVIEEAKGVDENSPGFRREYMAHFVDDSSGFFSAKKMFDLTVKDGNKPNLLIRGHPNKKYLLSIDPNLSNSPSGDYFAMAVLEIDTENERAVLVHNYGVAGSDLSQYIKYFYYLVNAFNIVLICLDNQDGKFIEAVNSSSLFSNTGTKFDFINYDGDGKPEEFQAMLQGCRNEYNLNSKKICFKQVFTQDSVRRINEQLQTWIDRNKIIFASKLTASDEYDFACRDEIPYPFDDADLVINSKEKFVYDLIDTQDDWISQVKKQCAIIEVSTTPMGKLSFDLPQMLKRDRNPKRARKDNYTTLLLGVEAAQAYINLMKEPPEQKEAMFIPNMFGNSTY